MATDRNGLEGKFIILEQNDFFETDEMEKKSKNYSSLIGEFLIEFSDLEYILESEIASILSSRSDDIGAQVAIHLEYMAKVELYTQITTRYIDDVMPEKKSILKQLKKRLVSAGETRNIIAHAKWMSLTEDGFVRSITKTDSDNGYVKFKYYKLTEDVLRNLKLKIEKLRDDFHDFSESTST